MDGEPLENRGYLGVEIEHATDAGRAPLAVPGAALSHHVAGDRSGGRRASGRPSRRTASSSVCHQVTNPKAAQSAVNNPGSAPRPVSIVGIANLGAQSEQAGLASVLMLLIAINIVFGILNMLPMIPLDGGHVAVAAYEWIRTKKGQPYYRADITKLFPVAALFIAFLALLRLRRHLPRHHPPAPDPALSAVELSSSLLSPRRPTRRITLGGVPIGDGAPITVQSMTTTKTADVDGTLAQIYALAAAGADIVRCTCNEEAAAEGLAHIVPRSPVPIVADIHFHHEMALAALEAGVQGLRLNPGNLRKEAEIKQVAAEARDRGVPIRIGVNAGSLHPDLYKKYGGATPEALVESARTSWPSSRRSASPTSRSRSRPRRSR